MTRQPTAPVAVTFGVLGPVTAATESGPVPLKGHRQRLVLARLLIAHGRVVPVDRLVDDLWEVAPDGAVGAIRTFVADLRRALEPDRPPRQPPRILVTEPPGYVLRSAPDAVDADRFEAAVGETGRLLAVGRPAPALAALDAALPLWRGPAYADCANEAWAVAEINRLDELRMLAVERRAEALLALGRPDEAAADLPAHLARHPLREDAWRLLAVARYRSGRQGDALAALRAARDVLVTELGVDPGPDLRRLEADILAQAPHLTPPPEDAATPSGTGLVPPVNAGSARRRSFVGRDAELGRLRRAAAAATQRHQPTLALLSGDPGAGKTALAETLTQGLAAEGWTTAWGRSPEYEGAPAAWPWTQVTDALAGPAETVEPAGSADGPGDPAGTRFRRQRAVAALVSAVADRGPVLLVLDDLHRADGDTLDLLTALLTGPQPATGPVLILGTYRATEISPELTATLARAAGLEPTREYLAGLPAPATGELARAVVGADLDPATVQLIHHRSGGNPFFVRELAQLYAGEGEAALVAVPPGVRDVIRHRLAQLPAPTRTVLRQAAVLGRDLDPEVLSALAGDPSAVLDAVDRALQAGFLSERETDGRLRFTHILVRDTLYADLSAPRRAAWHGAVAEVLGQREPIEPAALAHHLLRAGGPVAAGRAGAYARTAAERAERDGNPHEAARLWGQALDAYDRAGGVAQRERLTALLGLGRALAVTGRLAEARRRRAEAIAAAETVGDPLLIEEVLAGFDVPAIWTRNDDDVLSGHIVRAVEHALTALGSTGSAQRSRLLSTLALELRGTTTDRGRRAADEAEAIARTVGDPGLLAFALNARFMHAFRRVGLAGARARIGAELVDLAARHQLVTFEVLGHLVLVQANCALADRRGADAHARAADRLAERYELPLVGVFTRWYAALRLALDGDRDAAATAYRAAAERLPADGMPGLAQGLLPLALLGLRLADAVGDDRLAGDARLLPGWRPVPGPDDEDWARLDWGPHGPWVRPLLLAAADDPSAARVALRALPDGPHDLLREVRLCLTARAALAIDDRSTMERVAAALSPAAAELAAGSGVLTVGPVAGHLADLAAALGRDEEAAGHRRTARVLTARVRADDST
ncbi:BTAD domain-containing putative transcriptional regulator [Micromonospora parathelypteridis]|uniref:DNA-binding SARP family transcriptional activator n=1 Tax=Micromonospora parathelypteridis TaxID=1839617 RepID=A0A840VW13_9ACTN|nr:BTAD domain-containing putative transcriptional regulator [Micromonospora parathelypteridis]MBB5480176.1 DNA-binding SARP family transcriptional activator [Micromonospora parathelypteridis]GGO24597.1 ATPase AAA [Micromonospora parathelypteridis]